MREIVAIDAQAVSPEPDAVLAAQGVPTGVELHARVGDVLRQALESLATRMAPAGLFASISQEEFAEIHRGEGQNAAETPLAEIAPRGEHLALFAVTLGPALDDEIRRLFDVQDFALGAMLDAAASAAAERAGGVLRSHFERTLRAGGLADEGSRSLPYSPGYCGWHVSAQRRLFAALRPEEIGIRLRESCLMEPLKSISGVLVAGPAEIHDFDAAYDFCSECSTHACLDRIDSIR